MGMEENLGRTTVDIDILLDPARKQLDQLRTMTESAAGDAGDAGGRSFGSRLVSGVGSAMASIGRVVAVGAAAGAVALGGVAVAGAKAGIETAASMEQANIAFTTMLGSGQKASAFLGDLQKFAAATPFDFPGLQTAASSLISVGIDADKVIPIMTTLGNATSGMGTGAQGVQRATVALQQMSAAGKISAEDLNQLRDAGVPVFDLLAAATGKSVEQVSDLAQAGKLGKKELGELMDALASGKGLERFDGLMQQQSQSLTGMWSTLKDTVNMGLAQAIQPLIPMIKDGLGGATAFVAAQMPRLAAGLQTIVSWGQVAYGILFQGDYKGGLVAGLQEDSGAVDKLFRLRDVLIGIKDLVTGKDFTGSFVSAGVPVKAVQAIDNARYAVENVIKALKTGDTSGLGDSLSSAKDAGDGMVSMFGSLLGLLPDVATLTGAAADVVGFLADHADKLNYILPVLAAGFVIFKAAQAAGNVAALASLPIQAAQVASNFALAGALRAAGSASGTSAAEQVASAGVVQVSSLKTAATAIATGASVVAGWVMMGVESMVNAVKMAAAWVIAMGPVGWVIAAVIGLVALIIANWDTVVSWTETAWSAVTAALGAAWQWITSAASAALDFLVGLFLNFTGPGLIIKHWQSIVDFTRSAWSAVTGAVSAAWGSLTGAIGSGVSTAVSTVAGLPGMLLGALGNLGSLLVNAGKSVIQGFIDGIKGAFQSVKNTLSSLTSLLPDWKGPAQRDATILHNAGQLVMSGFESGLISKFGDVRRTLGGFTMQLAVPGAPSGAADTGAVATAARAAAVIAGGSSTAPGSDGSRQVLEVHAYEGQSVRSLATEVVNLGTWDTKGR